MRLPRPPPDDEYAPLQRAVEDGDPLPITDDVITFMHAQLGQRLREYYPQISTLDPVSPLGRVLARLTEALDTASTDRTGSESFRDELVGMVPRLRRYALSLTHDGVDADDLVQLTLLKAWEFRDKFERGSNLVAWLFTILRNGHINGRRKYWREVADPDGAYAETLSESAAQEHKADLRDLQTALARLDDAHREALTLVAVEGLTYEAAGVVLGCPPGTVKSRVSRARDRLSQALGPI